jgi:hypothetical protein
MNASHEKNATHVKNGNRAEALKPVDFEQAA